MPVDHKALSNKKQDGSSTQDPDDESTIYGKPIGSSIDLTDSEKIYDEVPILIMFKSIGTVTDTGKNG